MEQKEREEFEKEQRKKKSEKAFKKWLKLRNQNKYKSRVSLTIYNAVFGFKKSTFMFVAG
jgi:hypothetical protein